MSNLNVKISGGGGTLRVGSITGTTSDPRFNPPSGLSFQSSFGQPKHLLPWAGPASDGWSPVLCLEVYNTGNETRVVLKVAGWVGGDHNKPPSPVYMGPDGFVTNRDDAVNLQGESASSLQSVYDMSDPPAIQVAEPIDLTASSASDPVFTVSFDGNIKSSMTANGDVVFTSVNGIRNLSSQEFAIAMAVALG